MMIFQHILTISLSIGIITSNGDMFYPNVNVTEDNLTHYLNMLLKSPVKDDLQFNLTSHLGVLHCNVYCNGTSREDIVQRNCSFATPSCRPCYCNNMCDTYGNCCPDQVGNVNSMKETKYTCVGSKEDAHDIYGSFMITSCLGESTVKVRAVSDNDVHPVTSLTTNTTYINSYIADCNYDTNYTFWNKDNSCDYSEPNLQTSEKCIFYIYPDYNLPVYSCDPSFPSQNYIDTCNTTGLWKGNSLEREIDLEFGCINWTHYPVADGDFVFKNIYCFLCNGLQPSSLECVENILSINSLVSLTEKARPGCEEYQWYDKLKNACRGLYCRSGFELKEKKCEMIEVNLTNIEFSFRADFWPLNSTTTYYPCEMDSLLIKAIPDVMASINASDYVFNLYSLVSLDIHNASYPDPLPDLGLYLEFRTNTSCCRLEYEHLINAVFQKKWSLHCNGSTYDYVTREEDYSKFGITNSQTYKVTFPDVMPQMTDANTSLSAFLDFPGAYVSVPVVLPDCSFVYLSVDDFNWNVDASISLEYADIVISNDSFTELHEEQRLVICMSKLEELYSQKEVQVDQLRRAENIVSLFFSILSLVCLTLTLITYCTFNSLLTLPTKNTMCLVVSLFVAQFLLQFGGLAKQNDVACKTIGVLIHYFWLCVIFWMYVCSFHMFHVFVIDAAKPINHTRHRKRLLRYFIFANGTPALIVLATVTANLIVSSGSQIGYGDGPCYLSTALLTGVSFVLPFCIVLILNVIFFGMSVWTMAKISKMSDTLGRDRNQVHIYIRLSTLTGVFWIFSILAENLRFEFMIFISIFLNASQGVFIFISYVANTRILNMWRGKFGKPHTSQTSTETVSTHL